MKNDFDCTPRSARFAVRSAYTILSVLLLGFLVVFTPMCLKACANEDQARRVLEEQGYHEIEIEGYEPFGCASSDDYCTGFDATAPNGRRVHGVVGCGVVKACTVRLR